MKRTETFELLKPVVESIPNVFYADNIIDNTGGSYTLETDNTLWLSPGFKITIDSVIYKITGMVANESITIKGESLPVLTEFDIYNPFFIHGTILATKAELKAKEQNNTKFPVIYLHEITGETTIKDVESIIDKKSDYTLFFLVDADFENWLTVDHYRYSIAAMRNLKDAFIEALEASPGKIGFIDTYETYDHAKFGEYFASKGHVTNIFDEKTSGTELKITIPFIKNFCCNC